MNEWWTMEQAGMIGAIGGTTIGILGGLMGTAIGICAPRGLARMAIFGSLVLIILTGAVLLITGVVALVWKQPVHVWLPLILGGSIMDIALAPMIPVIKLRYQQADQRKLDAQSIRQGS